MVTIPVDVDPTDGLLLALVSLFAARLKAVADARGLDKRYRWLIPAGALVLAVLARATIDVALHAHDAQSFEGVTWSTLFRSAGAWGVALGRYAITRSFAKGRDAASDSGSESAAGRPPLDGLFTPVDYDDDDGAADGPDPRRRPGP